MINHLVINFVWGEVERLDGFIIYNYKITMIGILLSINVYTIFLMHLQQANERNTNKFKLLEPNFN